MKKAYANYISLGYFCEVAEDLEKLGLRNQSSPFDWGISDISGVISAIDNKFEGFFDYDNLSQCEDERKHYHEDKYNFFFYHDFNAYESLDEQYENVKSKYWRRIERFLSTIEKPTLFFRYISTIYLDADGKSIELKWIEENYQYILRVLHKYNPENDIIFIGDETVVSDVIKIYTVKKDENDLVSRSPLISNIELFPLIECIDFPGKEENIARFRKKNKHKNCIFILMIKKSSIYMNKFLRGNIFTAKNFNDVINWIMLR